MPDNPAARLQSMLEKMLEAKYATNAQISLVFSNMFGVDDEPAKIYPHYSQLFILINEAYDKVIQYYPKQVNTHYAWCKHFSDTFRNNSPYHHQWGSLVHALRQGGHLDMIQIANDNLEHFVRPTNIHGLSIDDLEKQVSELIADINSSDELSDYLKNFLKEELTKILGFIKNFDLYGSDPIRKSIYNVIGNIEVSNKITTNVIKGVSALLIMVASSIGIANDVASLPESIEKLKTNFYLQKIEAHLSDVDESNPASDSSPQSEVDN